uniref:Uncharacterized protein n=1 Tax=Amphimedon queenslandica TaxID=400682 RepID=A0A1X7V8P6_AMPQE
MNLIGVALIKPFLGLDTEFLQIKHVKETLGLITIHESISVVCAYNLASQLLGGFKVHYMVPPPEKTPSLYDVTNDPHQARGRQLRGA